MTLFCKFCNRDFGHPANLKRHQSGNKCSGKGTHNGRYLCPQCPTLFARHDIMKRHLKNVHTNNLYYACGLCKQYFHLLSELRQHRETMHTFNTEFTLLKSAHARQVQQHRMYFPDSVVTVDEGFIYAKKQILRFVTNNLVQQPKFRINLVFGIEMYKSDEEGLCTALELFSFRSTGIVMDRYKSMEEELVGAYEDIDRNIGEFLYQGSLFLFSLINIFLL